MKRAAAALERHRVPYLLGGGVACWARGAPSFEGDLDFMIKPADAESALTALVEGGFREERPPEQWLYKAWDGPTLVDLIFGPAGLEITDEVIARGDPLSVAGMEIPVMALEDILTTKLRALDEHNIDYERLLLIARCLREQIDWAEDRHRTADSPYAQAFFTLVRELRIVPEQDERDLTRPRVRVAPVPHRAHTEEPAQGKVSAGRFEASARG
jgi:hypothetical protein